MIPTLKTKFYIAGDNVNLDMISKALEIEATEKKKKSDWPLTSINAGIAEDLWMLYFEKEECTAISIQVDKMEDILSSKVSVLNDLCRNNQLNVTMEIVVEMVVGEGPEFVLTRRNISFLNAINCEIGYDLYVYDDEEDDC
jgi:hypothetical protein